MHRNQHVGRVRHFLKALRSHLVYGYLRSRTETVLDTAKKPVGTAVVPFELQYDIYYMFQHFRTGYHSVLGDMAYQYDRRTAFFGITQEPCGAFPYLPHSPGRRLDTVRIHCLYRVHYQQIRLELTGFGKYVVHQRLAIHIA